MRAAYSRVSRVLGCSVPTISRVTSPGGPLPPPDNNNINKKNTENKRLGRILERLGVVFLAFISYFRVQKNTGFLSHLKKTGRVK